VHWMQSVNVPSRPERGRKGYAGLDDVEFNDEKVTLARPGQSPFDPLENPEQALRLAESMRVGGDSKERDALAREGLGGEEAERKKSRMGFWTRTRTVAVIVTLVVVLVIALSVVFPFRLR